MLKDDAIKVYGSQSGVARVLEISASAVSQWGELVPPLSAAKLAAKSKGKLKFDPSMYADWNKPKAQTA